MTYAALSPAPGQLSPPITPLGHSFSNRVDTPFDKPPGILVSRGLVLAHEPRRRMRYGTLFPTLMVFILTSGLGVALLAWLWSMRKISVSEAFRTGYILVDEGVKREGGLESATLRALTATSFISSFISLASPVIMMLVAYRVACLWIGEQANSANGRNRGPTPLQYGLLLTVLSAPGIFTLWNAVRYLFRRKSRPSAPSYFSTAVMLGAIVYVISNLVAVADLWLHSTTSAVLFNLTSPEFSSTPLMTSLAFNQSLCLKVDFPAGQYICMGGEDRWAQWNPFLNLVGQNVVSNTSFDRSVVTLADAEDLSVVVPLTIDKLATFKATSFGARARCKSLNPECGGDAPDRQINCSSIGITAIPSNDTGVASVVLVAPYDRWDGDRIQLLNNGYRAFGPVKCCTTNPVQSLLQLQWSSQGGVQLAIPNPAVHNVPYSIFGLYASCEITFFNVTVTYDGRAGGGKYWTLVPEETVPSADSFATSLVNPYAWQLVTDTLVTNIKSRAMSSNSTEQVMAALNQEISRQSLGFASGGFEFVPATNVQVMTPKILGRYPLAPVFTFVILLFIYGFIALATFAMSFGVSSDAIFVPSELQGKPSDDGDGKNIPIAEIAQQHLLSPLPLVAQLFAKPFDPMKPLDPGDADAKSIATSYLEMCEEASSSSSHESRLRLGLEDTALRPRFGIWKCDQGV